MFVTVIGWGIELFSGILWVRSPSLVEDLIYGLEVEGEAVDVVVLGLGAFAGKVVRWEINAGVLSVGEASFWGTWSVPGFKASDTFRINSCSLVGFPGEVNMPVVVFGCEIAGMLEWWVPCGWPSLLLFRPVAFRDILPSPKTSCAKLLYVAADTDRGRAGSGRLGLLQYSKLCYYFCRIHPISTIFWDLWQCLSKRCSGLCETFLWKFVLLVDGTLL